MKNIDDLLYAEQEQILSTLAALLNRKIPISDGDYQVFRNELAGFFHRREGAERQECDVTVGLRRALDVARDNHAKVETETQATPLIEPYQHPPKRFPVEVDDRWTHYQELVATWRDQVRSAPTPYLMISVDDLSFLLNPPELAEPTLPVPSGFSVVTLKDGQQHLFRSGDNSFSCRGAFVDAAVETIEPLWDSTVPGRPDHAPPVKDFNCSRCNSVWQFFSAADEVSENEIRTVFRRLDNTAES